MAAVVAVTLVGLGVSGVAEAHNVKITHPRDPSFVYVPHRGNHRYIFICDYGPDGHLTRAHYELLYSAGTWKPDFRITGWDGYGRRNGTWCTFEGHWSPFRDVRVCVMRERCSRWTRVGLG